MPPASFSIEEATVEQIHEAMLRREVTAGALVEAYLRRIEEIVPGRG
jgi:Asp-tRNA(Asn)/Glu-tRNA(Gln) amidotransferase A subunit family amidase